MRLLAALLAFYVTLEIKTGGTTMQIEVPVSQEYYEQVHVGKRIHYRVTKGDRGYSRDRQVKIKGKTEK